VLLQSRPRVSRSLLLLAPSDIWSDSGVSLLVWQRGETNLPSWRTPPCAPVVRNGPLRTARTRWRFLNAAPPSGPSRQYAATGLSDGLEVAFRDDELLYVRHKRGQL
jgi:hypothetical protein